jgi:hypothetical protein
VIFEIAAILVVVYGLTMLSQLLARWRDVSSYFSRLMHDRGFASRRTRAPRIQRPEASLGFEVLFADGRPCTLFSWPDPP